MTILITGANRGIGQAILGQYEQQARPAIGTSRAPVDGLLSLDVTDAASHRDLASRLKDQPVELLICNAGIYPDKGQTLQDGYPTQMWADAFETNVTGVFLTIQSLLPNLELAENAKIAIISSIMASDELAPGGSYIYRSSKAAVLNLGRNLASDLKSQGISLGIYHPGWVRTDMGGGAADISVEDAANGLVSRFEHLSLKNTGCFETFDGQVLPY